jgi:hypothetical protein
MKDNIKAFILVGLVVLLLFACGIYFTDSPIVEEREYMLAWNRAMAEVLSAGNFGCEREFAVMETHESCVRKAATHKEMRICMEQATTELAIANKQCEDSRLPRMIAFTLQNAKEKRNLAKIK